MSLATGALLVLTLILLLCGVWIGAGLALAGIGAILIAGTPQYLAGVGNAVFNGLNSSVLTAIPLFLWMGQIIISSGASTKFYEALSVWVTRLPGGLLQTNIVASGLFSAIAGNSVATAATISKVAIPELKRKGYPMRESLGSLAAGGTLGILIPPSIPLILYASLVSVSVVDLFAAGIIPGILLMLAFMVFVGGRSLWMRRKGVAVVREKYTWKQRAATIPNLLPILILIGVVLGFIYTGLSTVTEAAAVGAAGALIMAAFYRKLSFKLLIESARQTVGVTAMIMLIIVGANILSYSLAMIGGARELASIIGENASSTIVLLLMIYVLFIVLGLFMEGLSMMLLTLPILLPALQAANVDLVWFAIVSVVLIEIGLISPPVGMNLFIIQGISKRPISTIFKGVIPYFVIMLLLVAALTIWPEIATWLPYTLRQ